MKDNQKAMDEKANFHSKCRAVALEMFVMKYEDLSDDECKIVSETVRKRF